MNGKRVLRMNLPHFGKYVYHLKILISKPNFLNEKKEYLWLFAYFTPISHQREDQ